LSNIAAPNVPPAVPQGPRPRYKRRLSNYLLDKKLQLRYVLVVTILSGLIAGSLGYLIYQQRHTASESIEKDLMALDAQFHDRQTDDLRQNIPAQMAADDRNDVFTMIGVGFGLVVILTGYLLIMTHKVAGPIFKISMYFDRMADGRLGTVTALRKGDMLQEFFQSFRDMHEAMRARFIADNEGLEKAVATLRESRNQGDYRGEAHSKLDEELDLLAKHVAQRAKQLA
jgi:hypothetical protein